MLYVSMENSPKLRFIAIIILTSTGQEMNDLRLVYVHNYIYTGVHVRTLACFVRFFHHKFISP